MATFLQRVKGHTTEEIRTGPGGTSRSNGTKKKYEALFQKKEDEHLGMKKNIKRLIDALEGRCQVSAYIYI